MGISHHCLSGVAVVIRARFSSSENIQIKRVKDQMSKRLIRVTLLMTIASFCAGCSALSGVLNPFYEAPSPQALLGEKSDKALSGGENKEDDARKRLETMSEYRREQPPQPYNPVMHPAVVRLMWIPDHLNPQGDLVPAHFYYLKVLNEGWELQDTFEMEKQLGASGGSASSSMPYVTPEDAGRFQTN